MVCLDDLALFSTLFAYPWPPLMVEGQLPFSRQGLPPPVSPHWCSARPAQQLLSQRVAVQRLQQRQVQLLAEISARFQLVCLASLLAEEGGRREGRP